MKNICKIKYILLLISVVVMSSCTDDFEEINTNPNQPTSVPTAYLMTRAQRSIMSERFNFTGALYAQHFSETQYTTTSIYGTAEAAFNDYYTGPLMDLQQIINLNTDEATSDVAAASGANVNQLAVARILKVLTFQMITDMWGEIPYSEALQGVGVITPVYDTQEAIYASFVQELTEAAAQIDVNAAGMEGDVIYGGDMEKWRKFANSLRLRVAMRMSEVNPATAQSVAAAAINAGIFEGNADNALFAYLSDADNDNPLYAHFITRTDYAISNVLAEFMLNLSDPRLPIYADPAPAHDSIIGMPYGVSEAIAGSITNAEISFPGAAVRAATTPGVIMTYSEALFLQAEAIARGWVSGDPGTTYNEAITANMEYWGVEAADITTYLAQPGVTYVAADYRQLIGEQLWISLYTNGLEAWFEWKRLDYPTLSPAPDALEGRNIPRRRAYTQREYDLNLENVTAAIARQGEDLMSTRTWWDQ